MVGMIYKQAAVKPEEWINSLRSLLGLLEPPFGPGQNIGVKLHWGEQGNHTFLAPGLAREIVRWLQERDAVPFIFDTTVLYSGGRHTGTDALQTAADHGYHREYLGCPVVIADGMDGRAVVDIPAGYKHFPAVSVTSLINSTDGFVIFSHFKGHMAAGFGAALKNLSMGFSSRAQKQRMHADVYPELDREKCTRCGTCVAVCPGGAARIVGDFPSFDRDACLGCAQCIALCPEIALQILWGEDCDSFQEKMVETAAALWRVIGERTLVINALLNIVSECDCLPGDHSVIAPDFGFVAGDHPLAVDRESLRIVGPAPFEKSHPDVSWRRQFTYAEEIGFYREKNSI